MKKIFLAILCLIFVFALLGCAANVENLENKSTSTATTQIEESTNDPRDQRITLVGRMELMVPSTPQTKTEDFQTIVDASPPMKAPALFESPKDIDKLYEHIMFAKKDSMYYVQNFEHYYIPVYAEQWCEPLFLMVDGIADGAVFLTYRLNAAVADSRNWALTLQFERNETNVDLGEECLEDRIVSMELQPFEACDGVFYKEIYEPAQTTFCWVDDGYCFLMQVYPELMEQIKENDPEALKGALFELKRVEL